MKINTQQDFWTAAETWYSRTHRLREIAESETETHKRKQKALKLFLIMLGKMQIIARKAFEISQPMPPKNFREGGIKIKQVDPAMN